MSNAININKPVFAPKTTTTNAQRPTATLWLNIGYEIAVPVSDGTTTTTENRFINLPMGIALDTMEEVKTTSSNETFAALQIAKNDLLKQLLQAGADLQPGQERIVNLQVQLRKVNDPAANAGLSDPNVNPFLRKLTL
jgi:hypothetical protein